MADQEIGVGGGVGEAEVQEQEEQQQHQSNRVPLQSRNGFFVDLAANIAIENSNTLTLVRLVYSGVAGLLGFAQQVRRLPPIWHCAPSLHPCGPECDNNEFF